MIIHTHPPRDHIRYYQQVLVDAHAHVFPPEMVAHREAIAGIDASFAGIYAGPAAKMATSKELTAALDTAGIDRAVAAGFAFDSTAHIEEQNAYLGVLAAATDGRVVGLATANLAHPDWRDGIERTLRAGAVGIGELRPGNQGWDPLGTGAHELCDLAALHRVPLLWHVSEPVGHAYPGKAGGIDPVALIRLASAHPGTTMVAAHLGGGLSFYLQMPEVRRAIENVYFDTAAVSLLYDDRSVARLVDLAGEQRVLFASDFPLLSPRRQLARVRETLTADAASAVCGGNAESLFFRPRGG
jgi:hypothetical protein